MGLDLDDVRKNDLSFIQIAALLLGIWHFVVVHGGDNARGAETFESWHESSNSRSRWEFISEIGAGYNGEICIHSERFEDSVDSDLSEPGADDDTSQSGTPNGADIHIPQSGAAVLAVPQECRICFCCKDWQGQVGRALLALEQFSEIAIKEEIW